MSAARLSATEADDPPSSLWQHPNFRRFWAGQGVSELGDQVTVLVLPLIAITLLSASPTQVGALTAAIWIPSLFSLIVGTWVEAQRRKRAVMIAADLFRALVLLSLPVAFWAGALSLVQLYAVALLAGTAHVVFNTAYPSFFVRLVSREQYLEANSKLATTSSAASIAGPAIGGVLIQAVTGPIAVVLDACCSWTSRASASTRSAPASCGPPSPGWPAAAPPSCSPRTTCLRRTSCATGSPSSPGAGWSLRAPRPTSSAG